MTRVRIFIDGNEANQSQRVGSNVYAFEILQQLHNLTNSPKYQVTVLLSSSVVADMPRMRQNWEYKILAPRRLWTQWALPLFLAANRSSFDVFYTPGHYAPAYCPKPLLTSVMDTAFISHPSFFKLSDLIKLRVWTKRSLNQAAAVVTISQYTKQQLCQQYHLPSGKILVAPPALPSSTESTPSPPTSKRKVLAQLAALGVEPPFFLHLGTLQPRKNIPFAIKSFNQLLATHDKLLPKPQLVLAGKSGWLNSSLNRAVKTSPFKQHIKLLGFVSQEHKHLLLQEAIATVHTGIEEGFGIPVLEALAHGAVPLVCKSSSLPEALGNAGVLVNSSDTRSLTEAMNLVLKLNSKERAKLRKLGREQLSLFNWQHSAANVLALLVHLAEAEGRASSKCVKGSERELNSMPMANSEHTANSERILNHLNSTTH